MENIMNDSIGAKMRHRMGIEEERCDLMEVMIKKRDELELDFEGLKSNALAVAVGGLEPTAGVMAGATFFLLMNPEILEKVKQEVRSAFKTADDITLASVNRLPYMLACINEAMRLHPPAVSNIPRDVHEGGEVIAGRFVPEGTIIEIQFYSMNHSSLHWRDPFVYRPERWLNKVDNETGEVQDTDKQNGSGDHLQAMNPFGLGPRDCIGRNLAYAEIRMVLARLLVEFDWRLAEESRKWLSQNRAYTVWKKAPLWVFLTPVKGEV
ncbi:hypothetical protein N0V88_007953 [Collariella sp. IMI 366227]|nr:hypothetical protein N0V88_007953 [Collariella sp. IMI 366227]